MLQAIAGLIILVMLMPGLASLWDMGITKQQQRIAAEHLEAVTSAASQYIRQNQSDLFISASATSGSTLSVADLMTEGLLPTGFQEKNLWGQEYQIHIRQPETNALQGIVLTTGGRNATTKFMNSTIPGAAAMMGGAGGFVPSGVLQGQSSEQLLGAGGGWTITLSTMGITSPGSGHLGALTSFESSTLGQEYLYRVAVPGNPELNAMMTELDMTDHAINNVHQIQFTEREISTESCTEEEEQGRVFLDGEQGLYICRNNSLEMIGDTGNATLLKNATLASNGDTIEKPTCPPNTNTVPMIFVAPSIASSGSEAPSLSSFQAWATSLNDTEWQVHLRLLTADQSWVYPTENYGRIMVMSMCAREETTP